MPKPSEHEVSEGILLAAGQSTRSGAITKTVPKVMLPLGPDYPILHWLLAEKIKAGISPNTVVLSETDKVSASVIENYLQEDSKRQQAWRSKGMDDEADEDEALRRLSKVSFAYQPSGRAGTAIALAKALHTSTMADSDYFEVSYGDDLFWPKKEGDPTQVQNLVNTHRRVGASVLTLMPVPPKEAHKYGVPVLGEEVEENIYRLKALEEKPLNPKSNYAQFGSQILRLTIKHYISQLEPSPSGEFVLAEAVSNFAQEGEVYGAVFDGQRFDTGNRDGYDKAYKFFSRQGPKAISLKGQP